MNCKYCRHMNQPRTYCHTLDIADTEIQCGNVPTYDVLNKQSFQRTRRFIFWSPCVYNHIHSDDQFDRNLCFHLQILGFTTCSAQGKWVISLHWRHNDHDGVSNHQPHGCLLNRLFRRRSKKTSKLRVTGPLCGEFTGTGEFPAQRASYTENVSIWWRHHVAEVRGHPPASAGSDFCLESAKDCNDNVTTTKRKQNITLCIFHGIYINKLERLYDVIWTWWPPGVHFSIREDILSKDLVLKSGDW